MSPRESYAQTLAHLRKQREQLQDELSQLEPIIAGLERLAKREASPASGDAGHDELPSHRAIGMYAEMELIPAVEHYLGAVAIPQTTQEIADALIGRGFRTRSKDFKNTVQALLKRAYDAGGHPLKRIGKSTWALTTSHGGAS